MEEEAGLLGRPDRGDAWDGQGNLDLASSQKIGVSIRARQDPGPGLYN